MWILKKSQDLLQYIQSLTLSSYNSIKTLDFSALFTSIPHSKLKDKLKELVLFCVIKKNGEHRYKYLVLGRNKFSFVKNHSDSKKNSLKLTLSRCLISWLEDVFCNRLSEFWWEPIVPLFLPTCFFIIMRLTSFRNFLHKKLATSFNFTFRYIDDVLSLNNTKFGDYVERIYPIELEIKDTIDTGKSALYLDLHLEIDNEGWLKRKLYDKRDDFRLPFVNFLFLCSNISAAPAYGVYISQLIRYSRACLPFRSTRDPPQFLMGFVLLCLWFSMLCCLHSYLSICLFIFSHGVVSLLSIYEFDCPSGIFRPSSWMIDLI